MPGVVAIESQYHGRLAEGLVGAIENHPQWVVASESQHHGVWMVLGFGNGVPNCGNDISPLVERG